MKRAMAILALLSAGASALAWASACREPTQLTLELTTDVKCSDHLTTAVVVGTLAQTAQSLAERPPAIQTSAGPQYTGVSGLSSAVRCDTSQPIIGTISRQWVKVELCHQMPTMSAASA